MTKDSAWLTEYRQVVAALPRGASVLPVYTQLPEGTVRPFLHAGSFAVIDRQALMPYLFSADGGNPMMYFRYAHPRYAPDETWHRTSAKVDWPRVACEYDYLLVMRPFERSRIELQTTGIVENPAAVLLAVVYDAC